MKKNMKLKITALVAMLFMALAVTFLSFSHADEEVQDESLLMAQAETAVDVGSKTNIDYIIQNSNTSDSDIDPHYNIVEIYSDTPSGLENYAGKSTGFEDYVINGHSSNKNVVMKSGMVNYKAYKATSITNNDTDLLVEISNADLIYVNQGSTAFSKTNDICEKLYDILHTYAIGNYKPLIVNKQSSSGGGGDDPTQGESWASLANDVFSSGLYYYTFAWDYEHQAVNDFLTHKGKSMYLGINGKNQKAKGKWTVLQKDGEEDKYMSRFLVISYTGASTSSMFTNLIPSTLADKTADVATMHLPEVTEAYTVPTGAKVYDISGNNQVSNGIYNAKYATPDLIQVEQCTLASIDDGTVELANYDFVIIDESYNGKEITRAQYNNMAAAMYGSISMVYPASMATASTSTSIININDSQQYNYLELYYMVASSNNISKFDNVMVTSTKELNTIIGGGETGAGAIADLINKSSYRGIGGKGSSSSMFTVLEIQPCYPIDVDLAKSTRGGTKADSYYTIPANVLNNVDKSTLPKDADGNITVEYYDWELTKNKVADAVGIDPDQINIVHMSTEELAANKEPLSGTYDMIYIGGNTSAFKSDLKKWQSIANVDGVGNNVGNMNLSASGIAKLPIYTMYSHNGDMAIISDGPFSSGTRGPGTPVPKVKVNGQYKDTFALLNGNDISYDRLLELEEFVDNGLPVLVEENVVVAYDLVQNDGYLQNALDPDCNMYKFLKYCNDNSYITNDGATSGKTKTVLWNVKNSSNDAVFGATEYPKVNALVKNSNTRPKLKVTSMPVIYNFYDKDTRLDDSTLSFKFEVNGSSKYTTNFYIDDDGNSLFDSGEEMSGFADEVTANSFKITLNNFFGPVYWKLEVEDEDTHMKSYVTGLSYIKNTSGEKQTVKILQIMPGYSKEVRDNNTNTMKTAAMVDVTRWGSTQTSSPEGAQGEDTLYFCPICQRGFELYEYYPVGNSGSRLGMWYYGTGAYYQSSTNPNESRTSSTPYLGKHEHIFGLPWYDSGLTVEGYTGVDDWTTNIADDISDLYDFDLDIMVRSDFEDKCVEIANAYDFSKMSQADKTAKINAFTIDPTDVDYAKWSALTTDDEKLKFITIREYQDLADDEYQLYLDAKDETDDTIPALEKALDDTIALNTGYTADLQMVKKNKRYGDIFSALNGTGLFRYNYMHDANLLKLANAYYDYRDKKDVEITHHQKYKDYMRFTNPDNWLLGSYDMIIIGASDNFALDDISNATALADLKDYIQKDGHMLLFHGALSPYVDSGSASFTATLREYFGMDKNRGLSNDNIKEGEYYVNYSSSDPDRYFMTNLSWKSSSDTTRFGTWKADVFDQTGWMSPKKYLAKTAYTDAVNLSFANPGISQYAYAVSDYTTISQYARSSNADYMKNMKAEKGMNFGTDKASQNNKGIVTQYPFTLSDELNISPTHPQEYALELDNSNMTVWYSLAGGTNEAKKHGDNGYFSNSSLYAASRNDGGDNYFIYTFGNVSYCGAGHAKVTGVGVDNNDERRLYINIIVSSVRKSVKQPGITVYDYKTEKKKAKDGTNYLIEVKNTDDWPEFSFKATVDTSSDAGNGIAKIRIYYDLDYLTATGNKDAYVNNASHIMIADMTKDKNGNPLKSGTIYDVGRELKNLQLKPEYFDAYNGEYTYIVIEVTDLLGNVSHQRIKIKLLPKLFEMT